MNLLSYSLALFAGLALASATRAGDQPNILVIMADDVGYMNDNGAEHKTWVLTPIVGIAGQHLASFQEFPIRQLGLSAQFGKTSEGIQSQILKIRPQQ